MVVQPIRRLDAIQATKYSALQATKYAVSCCVDFLFTGMEFRGKGRGIVGKVPANHHTHTHTHTLQWHALWTD
jgi:hypothetical protein